MADYTEPPKIAESALPKVESMTDVTHLRTIGTTDSESIAKENVRFPATQITASVVGITATDVNGALAEHQADIETIGTEKVSTTAVKQTTGTSESDVMSQKATTDYVKDYVTAAISDTLYYGVEWDTAISLSSLTRIGNLQYHNTLPVQRKMRRCLLLDNGTVNYYLHPNNSNLIDNGAQADLTGASGQVMVEIPDFYIRFEMEGTKRRCMMSLFALPGFYYIPKMYISAYEAAVDRTVALTPKLSSVVNLTANFRGGDNTSAWDAETRTLLGRPATNINLTNFRAYARNRGAKWNCNVYVAHKVMTWLMRVEYANFNNQLAYNAALTAEGYRQGGLGNGVTDIDGTKWGNFNGYNPFIPCGHTNLLGNATGVVAYAMPAEYDATIKTTYVPTYRGVENPFGHAWKWTDGCKCNIQSDASGALSEFYVCTNPANYQDADYTNYVLRGVLPRSEGYIKSLIVGEFGEMMPLTVGGSSTTYMCDYLYTSIPASGVSQSGVLFGGPASTGAYAGVGFSATSDAATYANAAIGSRLCYLP